MACLFGAVVTPKFPYKGCEVWISIRVAGFGERLTSCGRSVYLGRRLAAIVW